MASAPAVPSRFSLPVPPDELVALSNDLRRKICAQIRADGPMGFDRFMQQVLYTPGLGYYANGLIKFGPQGDFTTAPEMGAVFAQCLGQALRGVLQDLDEPVILELGAGSGALAADLLLFLESCDALPNAYWILEASASCRHQQGETMRAKAAHLMTRVRWLDALPDTPFTGAIIGNEVLDALPVHCFEIGDKAVLERVVTCTDRDQFLWVNRAASTELAEAVALVSTQSGIKLPPGYRSEVNLRLNPWLSSVSDHLSQGAMFWADYGYSGKAYYHPERNRGTLICHYRHRVHEDPFLMPGLQDISASVDFSALAKAGQAAGFELAAYTHQAGFLLAHGLPERLQAMTDQPSAASYRFSQQVKMLMLPDHMGERFQVMTLSRGIKPPAAPTPDLRYSL